MNRQEEEKIFKVVRYICGMIGIIWALWLLKDGFAMIGISTFEDGPKQDILNGIKYILGAIVLGILSIFTTYIYNCAIEEGETAERAYRNALKDNERLINSKTNVKVAKK